MATTLSACGFALRGTTSSAHSHQQTVALQSSDTLLENHLKKELALIGTHLGTSNDKIIIHHTNIARYELIGVLTEIRLVLSTTVQYQITNKTHNQTLLATKSYQYNEADVSTQDKEESRVREWLYTDMARQISEQYYTLSQSSTTP